MPTRNPYEVLGVTVSADAATIKKAFRELAKKHHPDKNPGDALSEKRFREISDAYEILSDKSKRANYDRNGGANTAGDYTSFFSGSFTDSGDNHNFRGFNDDLSDSPSFDDLFGQGSKRRIPKRGSSLKIKLEISFVESCRGTKKKVELRRHSTCLSCGGTGAKGIPQKTTCALCNGRGEIPQSQGFLQVNGACFSCSGLGEITANPCNTCSGAGKTPRVVAIDLGIPDGAKDGDILRFVGEGEQGEPGAGPGDLLCVISVEAHPHFKRSGNDVLVECRVPFVLAALGGTFEVPTLEGDRILEVKAGIQSGDLLKIHKAGVWTNGGKVRGDQIIRVAVEVPRKLTQRQEDLLREFAKTEDQTKKRVSIRGRAQ